jgi:hypothetical protein
MQLNAICPFIITNRLTVVIILARIITALIGSALVTRGMIVITKLKKKLIAYNYTNCQDLLEML